MRIIGILGSPRSEGNSSILAQAVLESAREQGAETDVFELNTIDFRGCQACDACKTGSDGCVQKDGLTPVLEAMEAADAVVLASPIYYADVSGQMKCFVDRTYSFFNPDFTTRLRTGRKSALILSQGDPDEKSYDSLADQYLQWLQSYGFADNHVIRVAGVHSPGAVREKPELLRKAQEIGRELAG